MIKFPDLLIVWAPLLLVFMLWMILRPRKVGQQMSQSLEKQSDGLELARESLELQRKTFSSLEIRAELKRQ